MYSDTKHPMNFNDKTGTDGHFSVMTPATYAFGVAMVLLGATGIYMMLAKPYVHQLLIIFFYSIPANCAISLFPHEPVLVWYGKTVNLWQLSTAATLGTMVAAYIDYNFFTPVLNLSYSIKYKSHPFYKKAHGWFYKIPFLLLVIAGFSPIPFYPFKFMVYSSKYPCWKYMTAVAIGRYPRYYLLALAGFVFQIPNWMIFGSFLVMLGIVYYKKIIDWISRLFIILFRFMKKEKVIIQNNLTVRGKMSKNISTLFAFRMAAHTIKNLVLRRPICIALEVTHNCTANCRHCDKGPEVEDNPVGADVYKKICDELSPSLIQIAGGEPLLRHDLPEIVRKLYRPDRPPYLVLITNGSLLTKEKYLELREAGMRQFSISLDFPDERHDDFRRLPGLFDHLNKLIPELLALGNGDVVVNTCITRANYLYILDIAKKVAHWGAKLNFSNYTDLRTNNPQFNLRHPEDTQKLSVLIDKMYSTENEYGSVMTSEKVLCRYNRFYENNCYMANCRTGHRFLIVNPDGRLTPCAMFIEKRYDSRKELIKKFANNNECCGCYISMRANTEKSAWELLTDNLNFFRLSKKSAKKYKAHKPAEKVNV